MGEIDGGKKPWQSKTLWINLLIAASAFVPQVHTLLVANPEVVAAVFAGLNIVLRLISKDKVSLG